jgi:hypothetical protein
MKDKYSDLSLEQILRIIPDTYNPRDAQRFLLLDEKHKFNWFVYGDKLWLPSREMCSSKGFSPTDYAINWRGKEKGKILRGDDLVLVRDELKEAISIIRKRNKDYSKNVGYRKQLFVEWIKVVDYIYYEEDTKELEKRKILAYEDDIHVDSRFLSNKLEINHSYMMQLVKKYRSYLEMLGPVYRRDETAHSRKKSSWFYVFNEEQVYLLLSFLNNTDKVLNLKMNFIGYLKSIKSNKGKSILDNERLLQERIIALSSYCSIKVRSETTIYNTFSKNRNATRRIDLLIDEKIAVELKRNQISSSNVIDTIGSKGYFSLLKETFPHFKSLVLCSPRGISDEAYRILEHMRPNVVFMTVEQLTSVFAEVMLKETPPTGHWWLYGFVFSKFRDILDPKYLKHINREKLLK